ncbi:MAG TPA: tripartite tricarboxylate transporter substrate binding protein [Ramlibacter sp.]|nr:tripartite tricarboxylate transporter substrate binding protein [Ramlibacter sp.]
MWCRPTILALGLLAAAFQAQAQAPVFPSKPIKMLVGSAPGGGTDLMARTVGDKLAIELKTPVLVENRPGVSNTLAADVTAKAPADGHTLLMGVVTSQAIAPHLYKLNFDVNKDLAPIALVSNVPNVLVVNNAVPAKTVQELVALAKSQPGKLSYASSGSGSTQHIAGESFKQLTGTFITHIPYRGSGPALVDLIGGQTQLSFDTMPSVIGQIQSGKVRALAVTGAKRSPLLPNVPTMAEAGLPALQVSAWYGIYAPAATPKPIQERLYKEVSAILAMPDTVKKLEAAGAEPGRMSQVEFAEFQASEFKRYGKLIKDNNLKVD